MSERKWKVATFCERRPGRKPRFSAYTLWYSSDWSGCVVYEVIASTGKEAKKKAIALRRAAEERMSWS